MSQIPSVNPLDPINSRQISNGFQDLKSEDFIRIIFTELSNQDPFAPSDSSALLDQLNSIRSIESDLKLTQQLEDLVFENKLAAAANLIGKTVSGLSEGLVRVEGNVVSVNREGDNVILRLNTGDRIPIDNIETILASAEPGTTARCNVWGADPIPAQRRRHVEEVALQRAPERRLRAVHHRQPAGAHRSLAGPVGASRQEGWTEG